MLCLCKTIVTVPKEPFEYMLKEMNNYKRYMLKDVRMKENHKRSMLKNYY
jgi:hypothetical protein